MSDMAAVMFPAWSEEERQKLLAELSRLRDEIEQARRDEREECARIAEKCFGDGAGNRAATLIRARNVQS